MTKRTAKFGRVILVSHDNESGELVFDEKQIELGSLETMYELIQCELVDCVESAKGTITAWVDEEGLFVSMPNLTDITKLMEEGNPGCFGDRIILAGNILFTGGVDDNGNTLALPDSVTVNTVKSSINWY